MKNKVQSATLAIELTPVQHAAVKTIAKKFRMKPEAAFKVLAFIPVNSNYEIESFREHFEDVAEPVLAGELPPFPDDGLAGCIEMPAEEVAAPDTIAQISDREAEVIKLAEPFIDSVHLTAFRTQIARWTKDRRHPRLVPALEAATRN